MGVDASRSTTSRTTAVKITVTPGLQPVSRATTISEHESGPVDAAVPSFVPQIASRVSRRAHTGFQIRCRLRRKERTRPSDSRNASTGEERLSAAYSSIASMFESQASAVTRSVAGRTPTLAPSPPESVPVGRAPFHPTERGHNSLPRLTQPPGPRQRSTSGWPADASQSSADPEPVTDGGDMSAKGVGGVSRPTDVAPVRREVAAPGEGAKHFNVGHHDRHPAHADVTRVG